MGNKAKFSAIFIVAIALILGIMFFKPLQQPEEEAAMLHKTIESDEVKNVRMGVVVLKGTTFQQQDAGLSKQEADQFRTLFNAVPADKVREVQQVNPAIVAGVVFDLQSNTEVRIQYDDKEIYVTRTDKRGQKKYIVDDPEMKEFFDERMKQTKNAVLKE
ncbi:hypothetical protein N0M98_26465 [Paenibacillus doosanensis]|uniref:Uncharacterized protein n=1 Tax=Paenibacillus konkukensis TaxID=2020716 RepID=A0ABY4RNA2_9BACL|nr:MULTISPECIES: hypothetical protein [Paenibacillus]MCS7463654.1 hypothetical protein [Paenibacillus doosanensis]UQZ83179.1 hypothetical protein SK3146_02340 [Paenibacillus konkukensis]